MAEATPLVSVLVPAFNHERYVERCLDSVLEDPWPAKEIVIVDDGSSDRTRGRILAWLARHRGELPVHYASRRNRGIAATLNEMAAMAGGEFLRLGASDDYLLPGGLAAQVRYLQAHPRKGAVIGDSVVVDGEGRLLHASGMRDLLGADKRRYRSDEGIRRAVIGQWAVGGPVTMLRKSVLDAVAPWREGLRIEDWDFFLRLVARDALGFIDQAVCAYRLHGANLSKTRHVATRVARLAEAREVALRNAGLFDEACRILLRAQAHYIGAKIAFLRRRPWPLAGHMLAYLALAAASRMRPPSAAARLGQQA